MFKALMVLTFGVISDKVCSTLVCFDMLFVSVLFFIFPLYIFFFGGGLLNAPVC